MTVFVFGPRRVVHLVSLLETNVICFVCWVRLYVAPGVPPNSDSAVYEIPPMGFPKTNVLKELFRVSLNVAQIANELEPIEPF